MSEGKKLHEKDMDQVLLHVKQIWGYDIILELWKDDEKIGQKSTDPGKVETVKKSTANNPFAYGMCMGGHV
jgi:spore cortex formation protein SpoVR/YcgB (stage V sporulation)